MFVGVKFGHNNWYEVLKKTKANYAEVWFRLDWQKKYDELFAYLKTHKINFGLHFWATVKNKYFPSLLVNQKKIVEESYLKICETLRIAAKAGADYVNFHPESYHLNLLDLDKKIIKTLNPHEKIDRKKAFSQLLFYLEKIKRLADKLKIKAYLETVPRFSPTNFSEEKEDRIHLQKSEGLETAKFIKLAKLGYPLCLDFGHTLSQTKAQKRKELFNYLLNASKKMRPAVGLIHVSTNVAPHNGTDSHNGILREDFQKGAIPDKKELKLLLSLFKNQPVWLIPEPKVKQMIRNYWALKKLVYQIEKTY